MRSLLAIFTFFFLGLSAKSFAQEQTSPYQFIWHSADNNSLPQNSVKSIVKDKYGYIWLSTEAGLVRYDGKHFKVYNSQNVKGLTYNRMTYFLGSPSNDSIFLWHNSSYYVLIKNRKISVLSPKKITAKYKVHGLKKGKSEYSQKYYLDNGYYYVVNDKQIKLIDPKNKVKWAIPFNLGDNYRFFLFSGKLYAIDYYGNCINFNSGKIINTTIEGNNAYSIIINDAAQQTFFYNKENLYLLQSNKGRLHLLPILKSQGLTNLNITSAFLDAEARTLYIGSHTNGLLIVKRKHFKTLEGTDKNRIYYAQLPYSDSTLVTSSGEVFSKDNVTKKFSFDGKSDTFCMMYDSEGNIWQKYRKELYCYLKKTGFKTYKKWRFENRVTQIFENEDGRIFIGLSSAETKKGWLYCMNPKQDSESFVFYMSLNFGPTYAIQNEKNIIWLGSEKGFFKLSIKEKKIKSIAGIYGKYVRSLTFENNTKIWITTYDSGFYLYDIASEKITAFPLDNKKNLLSAHYVLEDKNGFLWIPTNKGVYQSSKKNLLEYASGKTKSVYYQHYDMSEGFLTNEFNGGCQPNGLYLKNGFMSLPSMKGNVFFNPEKIVPELPDCPIYFEKADVDGVMTDFNGDTLILNQNFGRLRLFLSSPYYGNQSNLTIDTKLQGPVSQGWSLYDEDGVTFTTLPPGTYKFHARKLSGFDAKYDYKTLVIIIPTAFWQTTYFKFLIAIIICVVCFYFVKVRTKYIKRKNILLEKKISEQTYQLRKTITSLKKTKKKLRKEIENHKKLIGTITHDIKSPLRFLALTGKHIYKNILMLGEKNDPVALQENIKSMYTSSFQLYNFVDNLLEYAKISEEKTLSPPYSLFDLVEEKVKIFLTIADSKKIQIENEIDTELMTNANRLLISIIIHNLLDNSIKNTFNGKIRFASEKNLSDILMKIRDTGKGMDEKMVTLYSDLTETNKKEKKTRTGMGLRMIGDLVIMLEGSIEIKSKIDVGTEIIIRFPNGKI